MEGLVKSQLNLLKLMKDLPDKYDALEYVSKDNSNAEQYLERLKEYFSLFQKQQKT